MSLKTSHELHYSAAHRVGRVAAKKAEQEDWLILLAFNHLCRGWKRMSRPISGISPGDLQLRAVPGGGCAGQLPHLR